jgi:protein O-mannosyl-transferase
MPDQAAPHRLLKSPALIASSLACVILVIYWPLRSAEFIHLDDPLYITSNPNVLAGWTADGLKWAWSEYYAGFWAPVLWMSYMLEIELFGLDPGVMHLTNVILHALNAVLIFVILHQTTGAFWRSAMAAALFSLHPLRVESVAWIVERKDVLSLFFGLSSILMYTVYVRTRRIHCYVLCVLSFALGLMSKSMLVTLPCVLLLIDYWPLGRWVHEPVRRLFLEKIPLFSLTVLFSALTFLAHRDFGGVEGTISNPVFSRLTHAMVAYSWYIFQHVWPHNLALFYPVPSWSGTWPAIVGAAALLTGLTVTVLKNTTQRPYLFSCWFWFLGTLVPVIGFIQVGMQAWGDRFVYLPGIGLAVLIVWGATELLELCNVKRQVLAVICVAILVMLTLRTVEQITTWRNTETVARHALKVTEGNYIAETILGNTLEDQGRDEEAIAQYLHASGVFPDYFVPFSRLGILMEKSGRIDEAIQYYARALTLNSQLPGIQLSLGKAVQAKGQTEQAIQLYLDVLDRYPGDAQALYLTGSAYEETGDSTKALIFYEQASRIDEQYSSHRIRLSPSSPQ